MRSTSDASGKDANAICAAIGCCTNSVGLAAARAAGSSTRRNHNGESVGVTHQLAEQVVYLAYWENYPLEFWLEENGGTTVILARFSRQPELTFVLDVFKDGLDPHSEIQGWWNFFCETISTHAEIWQIPLVVVESVYRRLDVGNHPQVHVDIVLNR